jgi:ribose transport system substrate-binding protein
MKSTKLFSLLSSGAVALMMIGTSVSAVHSQAATPAATAAATSAAVAKYCTPDIAVANQKKGYFIPVISKGFAFQFWQVVKQGVYQAAQDCGVGVDYVGPADETQVNDQLDMLSTALARKPSAIVFAALDTKAAGPLLTQAQTAKIPIIAFDSGVANDIPVTTASTDNSKAAALAADKMAELIGGSGEVAVVAHDQTSATGIGRRDGFVNEIKAKFPNITIVDIQYPAGGDQTKSADATKAIIAAHPNLKGIFGTNEGTALGVVQAATELKLPPGKLIIIGYDSGKGQTDAIKSGLESGAITQNPFGIGYFSVEAAVKVLNGVAVPKTVDTGFFWYDKSNINDPAIALLLY